MQTADIISSGGAGLTQVRADSAFCWSVVYMEILALEASTASVKAMRYHTQTGTFEVLSREHSRSVTAAQRSADDIYALLLSLGRELAAGRQIDMISLCGTWHNILACNEAMELVTPTYFWDFTGAADLCRQLQRDAGYVQSYYNRTGCMVSPIYQSFKIKWLLEQQPELRGAYFLSLGSYITYRMTGQRVTTPSHMSGGGLLNTHTGRYDGDLLAELGLLEEQLCPLVAYDTTFPLSEEAAHALGLRPGIPVLPANADGAMNQVGAGALKEGVATLSIGTSGAIRLTTDRPIIPEKPGTWCYLSPKGWLSGAATNGCCSCIDWARHKLFPPGTDYARMEEGVSDPVNTPVFLPFLYGERCPGWNNQRRGGFADCLPHHNLADLYLAVQEGVLFNLYQCYKMLTDLAGVPKEIKLSGGILHSERWLQMCADIFGCTMTLDNTLHGSLLGACVVAMEKLGVIGDLRDFTPAPAGTVEPNPDAAPLYRMKFERYLEHYNKG